MNNAWAVALLVTATVSAACRESKRADAAELRAIQRTREQELAQRLAKADANPKNDEPVAMWMMPADLKEISGLALTADGRLLTHDDNVGRIFVIDPRSGIVLNQFTLGQGIHGDFEAITVAGNDIYLLNSNGTLYRFREGAKDAHVSFTTQDLKLGKECEFESMAYEADSAWLLLPCKRISKKKYAGQARDLSFSPAGTGFDQALDDDDPVGGSDRIKRLEGLPSIGHDNRSEHRELRAHLVP